MILYFENDETVENIFRKTVATKKANWKRKRKFHKQIIFLHLENYSFNFVKVFNLMQLSEFFKESCTSYLISRMPCSILTLIFSTQMTHDQKKIFLNELKSLKVNIWWMRNWANTNCVNFFWDTLNFLRQDPPL